MAHSLKKSIATLLTAALLATLPGPGAMQAFASMAATSRAAARPAPAAVRLGLAPVGIPATSRIGAPLTALPQAAPAPAAIPSALPGLQPAARVSAAAAIPAAVPQGKTAAAAPERAARPHGPTQSPYGPWDRPANAVRERKTALAAGRGLAKDLSAARRGGSSAAQAPILNRFWSGARQGAESLAVRGIREGGRPKGLQPAGAAAPAPSTEVPPAGFRPDSSREGVGPLKYIWWKTGYAVMQWINLALARDPNRRVSWDKWPVPLGLIYLLSKMRNLRADTITDPYDYATNDNKPWDPAVEAAASRGHTPDGAGVSDRENQQMGAANTRYSSNIPPKKVRPDFEKMRPTAEEIAKVRLRRVDPETGREIVQPALIMSSLGAWWIQGQVHTFAGNTKRDPIDQNPIRVPRSEKDGWPGGEEVIDRTTKDPTRLTDNGRPTPLNERTHVWNQAQVYGSSAEEEARLRSFENGHLRLDANGMLPEDPAPHKKGVDLTGFNNNYSPGLSLLHWLFVMDHNAIADHYRYFHPDWDDETLYQMARKAMTAQNARIHTDEWTRDLLQHPTLIAGMHADWYGLLGKRVKMFLMRWASRSRLGALVVNLLRKSDFIWGMPGSTWDHHDQAFQVPKQFRMVYRIHEMVLGEQEIMEPGTDRTLDRIQLLNFVHGNTRPIVEKFGYDVLAYSFVRKSAGALKLHNFPNALAGPAFKNQQNRMPTNLAARDILREREDGTGTFNEFRRSLGEPPVKDFVELTGGDVELARELEILYEGDIDKVDAGIGILAEPKPAGFALGFTQFYQFVLNATRRIKSNRHLTDQFTYADYQEGMDWVEHAGGMMGMMMRHLKNLPYGERLVAAAEGVYKFFAPWPDTETFPLRMLEKATDNSARIFWSNVTTLVLGGVALAAAAFTGALPAWTAGLLAAALALPVFQFAKRLLAWRYMQKVWEKVYTDKRAMMFPSLFKGEKWAERTAALSGLSALAVLAGGAALAWTLLPASPWIAALALVTGLSALRTRAAVAAYRKDMQVLKISFLTRMRQGQAVTQAADLPGETALEKRYRFLAADGGPVATLASSYRGLRESGLSPLLAFGTAALSHLGFARKSQRGLSRAERRKAGLGFFDLYLPGLARAQGRSNTRVYAAVGNERGLTPGEVDMEAFEDMFRRYAPGRDYMTAYDLARMREGNHARDARAGRGNPLSRWLGRFTSKWRHAKLMRLYADRVVEETRDLVPAISKDMLLRVYQGSAQADILRERAAGGINPDRRQNPSPAGVLPEGGFKGTTAGLKGRDVMALQLKKDPADPNAYYAVLSEYTRNLRGAKIRLSIPVVGFLLNFLLKLTMPVIAPIIDLVPRPIDAMEITRWVPRMYAYRVERTGVNDYVMKPLRVSPEGEIEVDPQAAPASLKMRKPGSLKGAVLVRDGETITFKGGLVSTWEPYVPGKYFRSEDPSGGDYFHKRVNTDLSKDGVAAFEPEDIQGSFDIVEKLPGFFLFKPKAADQPGNGKLKALIGVFIDIMNWKRIGFMTNELLLINPADPKDVGFFYERTGAD